MKNVWLFLLFPIFAQAAEEWIFLKDGQIVLANVESKPGQGTDADGKTVAFDADKIHARRTVEQLNKTVDAMIAEVLRGKPISEHDSNFKALRGAAVPRLLWHLENDKPVGKLCAIYGLQFCWSNAALKPLAKSVRDPDRDVARAALAPLFKHAKIRDVAIELRDLADGPDAERAAWVFECVERIFPDASLRRINRLLRESPDKAPLTPLLSHYFSPELTPLTLPLLEAKSNDLKRAAVVALISQNAESTEARTAIARLLDSPEADIREIAAEYFTWLGTRDDSTLLAEKLRGEADVYAKASLQGALTAIERRSKFYDSLNNDKIPEKSADSFAKLVEQLDSSNRRSIWNSAQTFYRSAEKFEPCFQYSNDAPTVPDAFWFRSLLTQQILVAPCAERGRERVFLDGEPEKLDGPLIPPIRSYFDPKRDSFGIKLDAKREVFVGSVHVGDDCGWSREYQTIVAIAPGIVRSVRMISSWGNILIVEHAAADGSKFCSLYAHLSPYIHVKAGDKVQAGQKIAAIGRGSTVENGGYFPHLHFGIHLGPYVPSKNVTSAGWICGYMSPAQFRAGGHGWQNPQEFLKTRGAK